MNEKEEKIINECLINILDNIKIEYYFIVIDNKIKYDIKTYFKYIFIYNLLNRSKYIEHKKQQRNTYILIYNNHNIYIEIKDYKNFKINLKKIKNYFDKELDKLKKIFNNILNMINNYPSCIYNPLYQSNFLNKIQTQLIQFKYFYFKDINLKDYFIELILTNLYEFEELYKYDKIEDINDIINFKNISF